MGHESHTDKITDLHGQVIAEGKGTMRIKMRAGVLGARKGSEKLEHLGEGRVVEVDDRFAHELIAGGRAEETDEELTKDVVRNGDPKVTNRDPR